MLSHLLTVGFKMMKGLPVWIPFVMGLSAVIIAETTDIPPDFNLPELRFQIFEIPDQLSPRDVATINSQRLASYIGR